jgi:hypothetical protein
MHQFTRRRRSNPAGVSTGCGNPAVERHCKFQNYERPPACDAHHEPVIKPAALVLQNPNCHRYTGTPQDSDSPSAHRGIRIDGANDDSADAGLAQRMCARRRLPMMRAWLERHVRRCTAGARAGIAQRNSFSVRPATRRGGTAADYSPSPHNDASDRWIRRSATQTGPRKFECHHHEAAIRIIGQARGHGG